MKVPLPYGHGSVTGERGPREERKRLARELAKLDRREEQRMAEEGIGDLARSVE